MKNKISKYNFLFQMENQQILYNVNSDGIILLDAELVNFIKSYRDNVDRLEQIHRHLFDEMKRQGMIVPIECDEAEEVINNWKKKDNDLTRFTLTILPTLDCNLRCWYCYEEHKKGSNMSEKTFASICRLVDRILACEELKIFNLDFYGGEPLLVFNKTVYPLCQYISEECEKHGKKMTLHFTTNGVLLTDEVRRKLLTLKLCKRPAFQITMDGNKEMHNRSKCTASGKPTFDIVIRNIKATLRDGMPVNNRFNYTSKTIDSFRDLLDVYKDLTAEEKALLSFDFQQVWQENHMKDDQEKAFRYAGDFIKEGYAVSTSKLFNKSRCPQEFNNNVSVNYDGCIYKCTAVNPTEGNRDGLLLSDGSICWEKSYNKWKEVKYGNETCRRCKLFPLYHGGCTRTKLQINADKCVFAHNEQSIEKIALGRLKTLLRNKIS